MDYQQITLTFESEDDSGETTVQTTLVDVATYDLCNVLTQVTAFLRAAGFGYVTQLEAHTDLPGFSHVGGLI